MKKNYILLITLLITSFSFGQIVINEVDADTATSDNAEFIELLWTPSTPLDGYVVVLFNGSDDQSYQAFDLDGFSTDANGFFILTTTSLAATGDFDFGAGNVIQNGADAVAVYQANDTDFPNDTPLTMTNLIDAMVYDTNDGDDTALLTGLGETVQYNENENGNKDTESVQRKTDGTYETKPPTFRLPNDSATCDLSLSNTTVTCDANTAGVDMYTTTIDFAGGGTATYTIMADGYTVSGDDPTTMATGTITISGVNEGTDFTVTITDSVADGSLCNIVENVTSPTCNPILTLPLQEPFDYTAGDNLIDDIKWDNTSTSSDEVIISSGNLSYTGLETSTGNSITFDGVGSDPQLLFDPITTGTVYASFIFKVTDQTATTDFTDGGYFAIIGSDASGFDARFWVRANPDSSSNQFDVGIGNTGAPSFTSSTYTVGDELFIVMSYETGTGAINAWVNPTSGELEAATAPAATISATDASPSASLNRFIIRQDSTGETPSIQMDELRLGTSWAQVTPTVLSVDENQKTLFNVYPNPVTNGLVNINSITNGVKEVLVHNILGKEVINTTITNNTLNVSGLNSGIYILKITEDGKTATKKLVIK